MKLNYDDQPILVFSNETSIVENFQYSKQLSLNGWRSEMSNVIVKTN